MSKYGDGTTYVREYVPELRDVDAGTIADSPTLPRAERERLSPEYSDSIVARNVGQAGTANSRDSAGQALTGNRVPAMREATGEGGNVVPSISVV